MTEPITVTTGRSFSASREFAKEIEAAHSLADYLNRALVSSMRRALNPSDPNPFPVVSWWPSVDRAEATAQRLHTRLSDFREYLSRVNAALRNEPTECDCDDW